MAAAVSPGTYLCVSRYVGMAMRVNGLGARYERPVDTSLDGRRRSMRGKAVAASTAAAAPAPAARWVARRRGSGADHRFRDGAPSMGGAIRAEYVPATRTAGRHWRRPIHSPAPVGRIERWPNRRARHQRSDAVVGLELGRAGTRRP